eukprot:4736340-Prymnesium_polylepis.2
MTVSCGAPAAAGESAQLAREAMYQAQGRTSSLSSSSSSTGSVVPVSSGMPTVNETPKGRGGGGFGNVGNYFGFVVFPRAIAADRAGASPAELACPELHGPTAQENSAVTQPRALRDQAITHLASYQSSSS